MNHPLRKRVLAWGGWLILGIALVGCSQMPMQAEPATSPSANQADLTTQAHATPMLWQGRLSLLVQSDPPQHLHAAFVLQGSPDEGRLTLSSPLGNTLAQAQWQSDGATLTQGEQTRHYRSLDALLRESSLGDTPIHALFDWLQGRANAADGWQVDLSRHAQGRIHANRQYPLPFAEIKIIVEQY